MPARRSSLILVASAAVLCSMLASPAGAARVATDDTGTSSDGSAAALEALSNVQALLGGVLDGVKALPLPGVPAEPSSYDATLALRDLALLKDELTGDARAQAEAYLARPTDPAGPGNPDSQAAYTVAEATPVCSGAVCVHYVPTTNDAPSPTDNDTNSVPDYVDIVLNTTVHVHNSYVAAGYRAPKGDGALGGNVNKTDIYIADIGDDGLYGYCTTDQDVPNGGPYDAWAYCVVDDDYAASEFPTNTALENLQVTVAHEYFHAVQFGYDIAEDSWLLEATAAWVEDEMYDGVNDNLQYLKSSPLSMPKVPMDSFGGSFHYGTWIFFRYLSERYTTEEGGLPTVVRDIIRKTDGSAGAPDYNSIQAVKAVLKTRGADFPDLFAKFAAANRRPEATYSEGKANHYKASRLADKVILGRGQTRAGDVKLDHLTSSTVRFTPAKSLKAKSTKARILVRMAPVKRGSAAVISVKLKSGKVRVIPIKIKGSGLGTKSLAFSARKVKYIELTLANAGTNYTCFNGGPYSCQGTSKNDNVKETYRVTVGR